MNWKAIVNKISLLISYRRKRKVILIAYDKDTKIVTAKRSQCGWVANWYDRNDATVSILIKDATLVTIQIMNFAR